MSSKYKSANWLERPTPVPCSALFEPFWLLGAASKNKLEKFEQLEMIPLAFYTCCRNCWENLFSFLLGLWAHLLLKTIQILRLLNLKSREHYFLATTQQDSIIRKENLPKQHKIKLRLDNPENVVQTETERRKKCYQIVGIHRILNHIQ